jgi:tetratricopeptide (TPR) repeat protein
MTLAQSVNVSGIIDVPQEEIALLLECGYLCMEMKKFGPAEHIFAGVAALVPHSEIPLICLGNLQLSLGRAERALRFHKDALKRAPKSALAHAHLGEVLLFLRRRDEAREALNRAIAMDDENGDAAAFARSLLDAAAAGVM